MAKVILFGIGQVADVAYFYLKNDSPHEVVAFTVDREYIKETEHLSLPVVPFEEIKQKYPPSAYSMFVPVAYTKINKLRAEKYAAAKGMGYSFISYVSSKATVWPGLTIGENCFILENNVIQPFVKIGNDVILWSGNHIGHHATIMDHCFIASHVVVSGSVIIQPYCFLGVNATLRDNITIARECVIGAGALILRDTEEQGIYAGQPAVKHARKSSELKRI